jgi:putative hydrolase of the HAD superfamily
VTRVAVFDVDDTLYLERDYVRSGFFAVAAWAEESLGLSGLFDVAWGLFLTGTRNTTLTDAFTLLGRPTSGAEAATAVAVYREHEPDIRMCPDAADLLDRIGATTQIAIITDGPATSQRAKINALGLASRAELIVVTAEHGADWGKPSTHAFRHVQQQLAAAPDACIYVADNPSKDFAGPKALGWNTVRIVREEGLHSSAPSRPGEIDLTVTSLWELEDQLAFA